MKKIPDNVAAAIGMLNVTGKGVQIKHDKNENFTYKISGMKSWVTGSSVIRAADKAYKNRISTKKNPARKKKLSATEKRRHAIAAFDAGNSFFKPETIAKMRRAELRATKKTTTRKNPIPHYIIRAKVKNRDTSFYYDGSRLVASKPQAKKFSDLRDAKRWGEKVWQSFPAIASVGVLKA